MANQAGSVFGEGTGEDDARDDKEKVAEAFSNTSVMVEEDQTRSSLHYGEDESGTLSTSGNSGGAMAFSELADTEENAPEPAGQEDTEESAQQAGFSPSGNADDVPVTPLQTEDGVSGSEDPDEGGASASAPPTTYQSETNTPPSAEPASADTSTTESPPEADGMAEMPVFDAAQQPLPEPENSVPNDGAPTASTSVAAEPSPPVNTAPEGVTLTSTTIAENASGAVVGEISVVDPDAGDTHEFSVSDDRFEVADGTLRLKAGESLDHEEAAQINVDVTATDAAGASVSQAFTINVADVNEGPTGLDMSNLSVAENASGAVVGEISVVDPDAGDTHEFSVSDDRFEVADGTLRLKAGESLDHEEAAQINVDVTATDAAGASVSQAFTINVVDMPDMSVTGGFKAEYFDVNHKLSKLDDIDWSGAPTHQEVTSDINYTNSSGSFWEGGSRDTFGAKITGNVEVEEGGTFNFRLGGDDGAMLFVNGAPVIDNDGLHGFRTRTGEVELEPGTHHIEVRYFENYGHAGLKLEWEGPGLDGRELVAAPDQDALQTVSGAPLTVDLDVDQSALGTDDTLILTDLPEGTVVMAGESTVTVDDTGTADITGWGTDTLSITPPTDFTGAVEANAVVTLKDDAGNEAQATQPLHFDVNDAHLSTPEASMVGGFKASYFDVNHSLRKIDDINWDSDPTHQEFVPDINYTNSSDSFWEGGSRDTFGAKLEGEVTIEEGGAYTFFAGGDDGVVVFVNGAPVIDNDGLHGFRTRSGEIELEPGTYEIEVRYFENYGHAGLKLEWEGPDTDGRELVTADVETHAEENGTFEVGLDLGNASDSAQVTMDGVPADTILFAGETSIVADGGPVDLTGLDVAVLEISPPPGFEGTIDGQINVTDTAFNGAEVSSSTPFSLTVGDPEAAPEGDSVDVALMMNDAALLSENGDAGWDFDDSDMDDDPMGDDVMSEPVPVFQADDSAITNTDTYERVDW